MSRENSLLTGVQPKEIVEINWPMSIPPRANFMIFSKHLLQLSGPSSMKTWALTPIHISYDQEVNIIPAGPATEGFARGWLRLPNELKMTILRQNLVCQRSIWPSQINSVMRQVLFPYLRMTPDIAGLSKMIFYQENRFVIESSSTINTSSPLLAIPPLTIRPLLRRVIILMRLTEVDWQVLLRMASQYQDGYTGLLHLEVKCLAWEAAMDLKATRDAADSYRPNYPESTFLSRFGQPVHFPFKGLVVFDRSGFDWTGLPDMDNANWNWVRCVEHVVSQNIKFRSN